MAIAITVPRLGWSMEEGTFSGWLKADGEHVKSGDMLFTLEGDKSAQEVESFDEGVLRLLPDGPRAGDTVKVGQLLGHLVPASETAVARENPVAPARTAAPPRPEPVHETANENNRISTPRARRRAAELGVDWTALKGSGRGGRVRERDVIAAGAVTKGRLRTPLEVASGLHRHSPLRLAIARRMTESHQSSAPVTLTSTVAATNLVNLRGQFRTAGANVPTYTDLIVKLVAGVLHDHPLFNARWEDRGVVVSNEVHMAFAVDTDAGLLAPVIRHADRIGLRELVVTSRALTSRAREGKLTDAEMQGGTFTVTNLGGYGIDAFTPILNPPQCAILGVGRVRTEAVPAGRRFMAGEVMTLSLTFDHRITDGGPAARFVRAIALAVENPAERLIG